MKSLKIIHAVILLIIFIPLQIFPQDINVHYAIGKKQSDVIKQFGKPVHQDNSNPAMVCMFYKGQNYNLIFVSDQEGVYQSEANVNYAQENTARAEIDKFISKSLTNEFTVDTVSAVDFRLQKKGVKVELQLLENRLSNRFEIRVKANRSEG